MVYLNSCFNIRDICSTKIKNEKSQYLQTARLIDLNYFSLLVPAWWSVTDETNDHLKFERTDIIDTRYDWFASI